MGAEELIFWSVPVVLLVVFTLALVNYTRDPRRRKLLFIEPLGTLLTKWRPVRYVGEAAVLKRTLEQLVTSRFHDDEPLELVLTLESPPPPRRSEVVERRNLGLWSEQRVLIEDNRTVSVIAGRVADVLAASRYRSDGRTLLTESDRAELKLTAERACQHGYLPLGVARRYFHSRVIESDKHTWVGLIFLEPLIGETLRHQLQQISPSRRKLLTVLPTLLAESLWAKLGSTTQFPAVPTGTPPQPRALEETWERSNVIGDASADQRHAVVRYFEMRRDCRLLSVLPSDRDLPIRLQPRL